MRSLVENLARAMIAYVYYRYGWLVTASRGVKLDWNAKINPKAKISEAKALGSVEIGRNVEIGYGSYASSGIIQCALIGKYCSIGPNTIIGPTEHSTEHWTTSPYESIDAGEPAEATDIPPKQTIIADGVWIGANVIIRQGIKIGARSIIGAGSVVTKSVPSNEIWAGIPAKKIRSR